MTAAATVVRTETRMVAAMEKLQEFKERYRSVKLSDTGMWTNQNLSYARALRDMLKLAEVILRGGIERKESRGSHYRPDFPERDDEQFLKTTVARYDRDTGRPELWFDGRDLEAQLRRLADLVAARLPEALAAGSIDLRYAGQAVLRNAAPSRGGA